MIDHRSPGLERWKDPRCSPRCPDCGPGRLRCLPFVRRPHHFKRRSSRMRSVSPAVISLDRPAPAVNLQVGAQLAFCPPARNTARTPVDAVEDLAVHRRTQQLQILRMRPHQRNRRSRRLAHFKTPAGPPRPTPAPASSGPGWRSAHRSRSAAQDPCPPPARSARARPSTAATRVPVPIP